MTSKGHEKRVDSIDGCHPSLTENIHEQSFTRGLHGEYREKIFVTDTEIGTGSDQRTA